MGYNVAAYIEKRGEDGKWELVTPKAVSSNLKYIFTDYKEKFSKIEWESLSDGLKKIYAKDDENGTPYCSFYQTTIYELERNVETKINSTFTRLNTIVKALGCSRMYSDSGDESWDIGDDTESSRGNQTDPLTIPVSKSLVGDLQFGFDDLRKIGQLEAIDLVLNENIDYGSEHRVVLVVG